VFDEIATSNPSRSNRPRSRRGPHRDSVGRLPDSRVIALLAVLALILAACGSSATVSSTPVVTATPTQAPTAAGDPLGLVGDWNVTYGAPTTLTISYANGIYTMTAAAPVQVVRASCSLPVGTVIATFARDAAGKLAGQHGLWLTTTCAFAQWTPMSLVLEPGGLKMTATLGNGEVHAFTRSTSTPGPNS
jgi:hypothetical protein